ncbi:MAG: 16S rRNA (cytosine(967)-C(5))-methyltransferase RsmB [Myxococcales bacterium]|nr:MAG: 16S rRNA (cytosine(967)-C(5))-methyltransferase RsmB [Myxococcales bacterium]
MSARLIAFRVLSRVERDGAYSNLALVAELNEHPDLEPADRRLATELVYGVLRNRRLLDEWIEHLSDRPGRKVDPAVRHVLRLSLHQLLFLDRMPAHAVLAEAGKLLRRVERRHAVSFANALLRRFLRERKAGLELPLPGDPLERLKIERSIPDWLLSLWRRDLPEGDESRRLSRLVERAERANRPAPLTVVPNPLKLDRDALCRKLTEQGATARPGEWARGAVLVVQGGFGAVAPLVAEGLCHVMDEASQLVVETLAPENGERVLDLCAAPGGKSLLIAGRTGPEGKVVSVDQAAARLGLLSQQAARHGYGWIEPLVADVTAPIDALTPESFDRVLVDAPCSALGVLHRHPEIRWRRQAADIPQLAAAARQIAAQATRYVRPGGVLTFSVCTTTREEGMDQLRHLAACTGWAVERVEAVDEGLWKKDGELMWIDTSDTPALDGFFICRLRKPGGSPTRS